LKKRGGGISIPSYFGKGEDRTDFLRREKKEEEKTIGYEKGKGKLLLHV